jgi:hypothetical protein
MDRGPGLHGWGDVFPHSLVPLVPLVPKTPFGNRVPRNSVSVPAGARAKRSFAEGRSQTEFGNEMNEMNEETRSNEKCAPPHALEEDKFTHD